MSVPAFTPVEPVYVLAPPNVSTSLLTFTNEPAPEPSATTPPNVPLLNVNAVPFNVTNPLDAPSNVSNVAAAADNANVPSNVTTASTGTIAPAATVIVAPLDTPTTVDANRPAPLNANVPAFTVVDPVNVFTPLNSNVPLPTFTNEPGATPSANTPPNVPTPNVNAVPSTVTNPLNAPSNRNNVTAAADNANVPSTVTAAPVANAAPASTVKIAPLDTPTTVDANRPVPPNVNAPALTIVDPVYVFTALKFTPSNVSFTNAPTPPKTDVTLPFLTTNAPAPNVPPEINPSSNVTAVTA
jgi:hypothetical protein